MIAMGKELIADGPAAAGAGVPRQGGAADPQSGEAKHQAGYANYLLKNYQGAVALYNAALIYDKGNSQIYKRLALAYRGTRADGQTPSEACRKYVEMEPDAPDRGDCDRLR